MSWSDQLVKKAFAIILLIISLKMLVFDDYMAKREMGKTNHSEKIYPEERKIP
jgi:hypothetical protein